MRKSLSLTLIALVCGGIAISLWAGDGHENENKHSLFKRFFEDERDFRPTAYLRDPQYPAYLTGCGDCHMAYPANMLPGESWQAMMASLDNHFGDNAELDPQVASEIGDFLNRHAAGPDQGGYSARLWRSTRKVALASRITDTDYFRGKHHEITTAMVTENPDIGSFSRCDACHADAAQGAFDEHQVSIPGYGRWDD